MTNKLFNRSFNLTALSLALLFTGLYSCSEKITSEDAPVATQANVAPVASVLKSAHLLPDVEISSVTLWAGQHMNAGSVTLYQTDTNGDHAYDAIKVKYALTGDWYFDTKVHFYIGTGPVPTNPGGNIAPGSFPYILTASTNPFSFTIPFTELGFQGCTALPLNVAAHAELSSPTLGHQTGFGAGSVVGSSWFTAYTVTLTDKTPPTASNKILEVGCESLVPAQSVEVINDEADNCTLPSVPVTFVNETSSGTCPKIITRNYLVTDAAGNTSTVTYTITVNDVTAPVLSGQGANQTIGCVDPIFTPPTANDACKGSLTVTTVTPDIESISNVAGTITTIITRTWTATDGCNTATVSQTITKVCTPPTSTGPCFETTSETAWAAGTRYVTKGSWATYVTYASGASINLYAGQNTLIGTATFSAVVGGQVTINVNITAAGWELVPGTDNVKVQGYAVAPKGNPSPGSFANKLSGTGSTATITVPAAKYYGVHLDVQLKVEVPCPVTVPVQ